MKLVVLSDLHGDVTALDALAPAVAGADVVLLAGDLTHFGREAAAAEVVGAVRRINPAVLAVPGNCDRPEAAAWLERSGLGLDGRCEVRHGIAFIGAGGSIPCPGRTPNERTEEVLADRLESARRGVPAGIPVVLLVHQPPLGSPADMAGGGTHVGSTAVRDAVRACRPVLCACGHIHESRCAESWEGAWVVNPGPLREGHYGVVRIESGAIVEAAVR